MIVIRYENTQCALAFESNLHPDTKELPVLSVSHQLFWAPKDIDRSSAHAAPFSGCHSVKNMHPCQPISLLGQQEKQQNPQEAGPQKWSYKASADRPDLSHSNTLAASAASLMPWGSIVQPRRLQSVVTGRRGTPRNAAPPAWSRSRSAW